MSGPRLLPTLCLLAATSVAVVACQREATPPLIEVQSLSPREVETGDRLQVVGVGFPEGKIAHVSFLGDLARPGTSPLRGVEIDVEGAVVSSTQIEVAMGEALERQFVGAGDRAAHTTFTGDVRVAFAASSPAAPPVLGTVQDVWLDVRPPIPHRAVAAAEAAEGERTLAFLGIRAAPGPVGAGGVLVQSIEPTSKAEAARLLPGDVITEFDGVRVLSTRDLVAASGERAAWLKIRRGGSPREEVAELSLVGLAPSPATALLGPVLILGLAAILLILAFGPTPDGVAWLERRVVDRLRALRGRPGAPFSGPQAPFESLSAGAAVLVGASATFAVLPFASALGAGDLDVGLPFVVAAASLAMAAFVTGGSGSRRAYSWRAAMLAVVRVACLSIPGVFAVVGAVARTGSLRLDDLVRAQGGWPWQWTAFASPPALGLLAVWSVTALAEGETQGALPEADDPARGPRLAVAGRGRRAFSFVAGANLMLMCALAAAMFLGGWQIPGLAHEQVEAHVGWALLGAGLFVAKAWLLVSMVLFGRWTLPAVRSHQVIGLSFRVLVPLSLVFLLAMALWITWGPGPSVQTLIGAVTAALGLAAVAHVVTRVRSFADAPAARASLDPFL